MKTIDVVIYLEKIENIITNYKIPINLFKNYCNFLQILYINKYLIDYLKYAKLLDDVFVVNIEKQEDYLSYQYYKSNIKALIYKLEKSKSK